MAIQAKSVLVLEYRRSGTDTANGNTGEVGTGAGNGNTGEVIARTW